MEEKKKVDEGVREFLDSFEKTLKESWDLQNQIIASHQEIRNYSHPRKHPGAPMPICDDASDQRWH